MKVTALAGGVGAGKFLRGLIQCVPAAELTVIVNTADDIDVHGMHVSPDIDSVMYWLAGVADRERGWGRAGETFRATGEARRLGAEDAWFGLGDLDLAVHLLRTRLLADGATLSEAIASVTQRFGLAARLLPMTDDRVTTRLDVVDGAGTPLNLHFQEYWVKRGATDTVKAIRYVGSERAHPAPGVIEAIREADAIVFCPSNPIASIGPILAVPGIREAIAARSVRAAGVSPIVGGAPVRGMADKLLPVAGVEVSAVGVAAFYRGLIRGWVIDEVDAKLARRIEQLGLDVVVRPTMMVDDRAAAELAAATLEVASHRHAPANA